MTTTEDRPAENGPRENATVSTGRPVSKLPAPEERGSLEVSPTVVRKVAQRAADRTPGTLRASRRTGGKHGSSARVDGTDSTVDIVLDVALRYPAPVREITETVRRQVTDEVRRIPGYRVRAVTFTVSALLPETRPRVE